MTQKEAEIIQDLKIIKMLLLDMSDKTQVGTDFFLDDTIFTVKEAIDNLEYALGV